MASLEGKNINSTYSGLLKTSTNDCIIGGLNRITDGNGNPTALCLGCSSTGSIFDSSLVVTTTLLACCQITTNDNLCVKGKGTFDGDINVTGSSCTNSLSTANFVSTGTNRFDKGINLTNSFTVSGCTSISNTDVHGALDVQGALDVGGATTLGSDLTVTGTLRSTGDIVAFYTSDNRLKDNLVPINSSNYVNNLTGYEFNWNERSKRNGTGKGIIAQDLHKIDKDLVRENSDGYLTVDYIGLIPVLIEEVKRLGNEIEKLKKL